MLWSQALNAVSPYWGQFRTATADMLLTPGHYLGTTLPAATGQLMDACGEFCDPNFQLAVGASLGPYGVGDDALGVVFNGLRSFANLGREADVAAGAGTLANAARKADEANAAAKTAGQLGQEGEAAVRAVYGIGDKAKLTINSRTRIPDGLTKDALSEVKNVDRLSFTRQLRDYLGHAQGEGLRFDLYTRPNTQLSGPLQNAVDNGLINHLFIPQ